MSKNTLVSLDPPEILTFQLIRDNGPKVILKITNISQFKIIFKVKTTQPSWYFVRPNQQVLDINGSEEVSINLIAAECNRFLEMTEDEKEGILNKHRFLVQTKIITDDIYTRISSIPQADRIDEYQNIWDTASKEDLKNHKLKVEFIESPDSDFKQINDNQSRQYSSAESKQNNNIHIDTNTSTNATPSTSSRQQNNSYSHSHHDESQAVPGSPESIYAELQSLRKKYDAVVEYTVHLTAERDYHFTQLEELKKEINKEKLRKNKSSSNVNGTDGQQQQQQQQTGGKKEVIVQQGFSFIVVIIIAVISFLIAKYTS